MKCIVGLGNPGPKYQGTRHNIGFAAIHQLAQALNVQTSKGRFNSVYGHTTYKGEKIHLLQPLTYMNNSGKAVRAAYRALDFDLQDLLIVYDDMDFEVGELRFRLKGSSGGHNGLGSVIDYLGTREFPRLRLGIGSPSQRPVEYVLGKFDDQEQQVIDKVVKEAADGIICFILDGIDLAMNRYNKNVNTNS